MAAVAARPAPWATSASRGGGLGTVLGLLVRQHRVVVLGWAVPLLVAAAVVIPAYQATYPDPAQREIVAEQMRDTTGTRIMYGILPPSGTLGQMFAWELGTYLLVLTGVMAITLAVATTRAAEDAGTLELVRAGGARPGVPLAAATTVVAAAVALVAVGTTVLLLVQSAAVGAEEISTAGCVAFGAVQLLSGWCLGAMALCLAQALPEARAARSWALSLLAVAFVLRILADEAAVQEDWPRWVEHLRWLSPIAWRDVVAPFEHDRFGALVPLGAVCAALAGLAAVLQSRREYGAGIVRDRSATDRRMRVRGVEAWAGRSSRALLGGWTVTVALLSLLFGSMVSGVTSALQESERTRQLWDRMAATGGGTAPAPEIPGEAELLAEYYQFLGVFMALLVAVSAAQSVLRWRAQEKDGLMDLELAAGTRRWRSLLARCLVAAAGAAVLLALSGALMGWLGERQLAGEVEAGRAMDHALSAALGHLPGVWAVVGIAALLIAVVPRLAGLVWLVVGWSGFAQLFGGLVGLPSWALDAGVLSWSATPGEDPPWAAWAILLGLAAAGSAAGAVLVGRRDVRP